MRLMRGLSASGDVVGGVAQATPRRTIRPKCRLDIVLKSSGNVAFDRSAVLAVRKSSPLPKPKDDRLFQREIVLDFTPDS